MCRGRTKCHSVPSVPLQRTRPQNVSISLLYQNSPYDIDVSRRTSGKSSVTSRHKILSWYCFIDVSKPFPKLINILIHSLSFITVSWVKRERYWGLNILRDINIKRWIFFSIIGNSQIGMPSSPTLKKKFTYQN